MKSYEIRVNGKDGQILDDLQIKAMDEPAAMKLAAAACQKKKLKYDDLIVISFHEIHPDV